MTFYHVSTHASQVGEFFGVGLVILLIVSAAGLALLLALPWMLSKLSRWIIKRSPNVCTICGEPQAFTELLWGVCVWICPKEHVTFSESSLQTILNKGHDEAVMTLVLDRLNKSCRLTKQDERRLLSRK